MNYVCVMRARSVNLFTDIEPNDITKYQSCERSTETYAAHSVYFTVLFNRVPVAKKCFEVISRRWGVAVRKKRSPLALNK